MPDAGTQPYRIRPGAPEDLNFVLGPWLNGFRRESPFAHRLTDEVFFGSYRPIIIRLIEQSSVLIAESEEGQDVGAIVWQPETFAGPALHWAYVLKSWRGLGIGKALLSATGLAHDLDRVRVTHPTWAWFSTARHGPGLEERFKATHDPVLPFYLAFKERPHG